MSEKYVVAVYDYRSKQEYIYKTNRVKQIVGASEIIKSSYKRVLEKRPEIVFDMTADFSLEVFKKSKSKGTVLYEGGGNIVILYKSKEAFISFNRYFSKWLRDNARGLNPICGMAEFDYDELEKKAFREIKKGIEDNLDEHKRLAPTTSYNNVLPLTQNDRSTSQPIVFKDRDLQISLSKESKQKLDAFNSMNQEIKTDREDDVSEYAQVFDSLVEEKGEESLIAVIYIDGNGLGQQVQDLIPKDMLFEEGVKKQREFTVEINEAFVKKPLKAIAETVDVVDEKGKAVLKMRQIIGGGDEITIVCNARKAHKLLKAYFKSLHSSEKFSACAGVVICHSGAPFSEIYSLAEACCESGKKRIKKLIKEGKKGCRDNSYIDAYFCRSAITADLEILRNKQVKKRTKMPYCVKGNDEKTHSYEEFERIGEMLKKDVKRTNVKALRDAAFRSEADFILELLRIQSNAEGKPKLSETDIPILCDVSDFYDIWFREDD